MAKELNVEIGERLIKVCIFGNQKKLQVQRSFMFQTPEGAVSDGQINDPETVAKALKTELYRRKMRASKVLFSITSGKVATREVHLPPIKKKRLKALVESNASEYFPVDMSNYHITYSVLDSQTTGEHPGHRVLVMVAPLNILEGYFQVANLVGLQIKAIDYFGNSLYRALEDKNGEEVTMYVSVGCKSTCITFLKGKQFMLQRILGTGTDELILNYMQATSKGEDAYIDALRELSDAETTQETLEGVLSEEIIADSLERLIDGIVRVTDHFNSMNWEAPVEKIVLLGACCRVVGLTQMLSEQTTLEPVYLDAVSGFSGISSARMDVIAKYLSCMGASIQPVDFIPAQFSSGKQRKKDKAKEDSIQFGVVVFVMSLFLSSAIAAVAILDYTTSKKKKEALEKQIADLSYVESTYQTYQDYQNCVSDFEALFALVSSPNDQLASFIAELEEKMPAGICVLSANCSTDGVSMNVTVPTKAAAAMVIVQLRSFESIEDVNVSSISETTDDMTIPTVSFSVSCNYVGAEQADAVPSEEETAADAMAEP